MKKKEEIGVIYRAALVVFAEFGYRKSTVEDIASRLGMTKGNIYLYAKGKQELYRQSVAFALRNWQGLVRAAVKGESDPGRQFEIMALKAMEYLAKDDDLRRILVRDPDIFPMFTGNDPYGEINRDSVNIIRDILKRGIEQKRFRPVDLSLLPQILFLIYKMFIIGSFIAPSGIKRRKLFRETLDLITKGLFLSNI